MCPSPPERAGSETCMNGTSGLSGKPFLSKNNAARTALMYCIAALALFWVFHDINISLLKRELMNIIWPLALLGGVADIGRYVVQGVRWNFLLKPVGKISVVKTLQALYAGIFLNLLFPLRIGEVARVYLASRYSGAHFPSVVSSLFAEYIFDGIWLALGIAIAALFVPFPTELAVTARVLGAVLLASICLFVFLLLYKRNVPVLDGPVSPTDRWRVVRHVRLFLRKMRHGLQAIGGSRMFWISFAVSCPLLAFHLLAFWLVMLSYGIHLSFFAASAVLLFVFVGLIVPNTPSNVGAFQFLCVVGLMAFGVEKTAASGFSVFVFIIVNIPQIIFGWIAFGKSGHTLYEIRNVAGSTKLKIPDEQ